MLLADRLKKRIRADGPMPFEEFMEACLYDAEHGFFATGPLRSVKSGDFLTSPEVSPWFGRMLGRFVEQERERVGADSFFVADVGAGSGSLLDALDLDEQSAASIYAIDRSPASRAALAEDPSRSVGSGLVDLPAGADGVIFANELLDNLPASLAVRREDTWVERRVGLEGDDLALVDATARDDVVAWADAYAGNVVEGGMVEVQLAAAGWLEDAFGLLGRGAVVVIDYGGTAEELEPRRTRGTLRTYRAHHLGPDPLLEPGRTDVTVDVNFTALEAVASTEGAEVELVRQDDFLYDLGLREVLGSLRHRELELARSGDAMDRLKVRSERTDAETIVHPRGLGDFRVLLARK